MISKTLVNCTVLCGDEEYESITFNENVISLGHQEIGSKVIDMDGAMIVPGFVDSHTHLHSTALKLLTQDLDGLSRRDVIVRLSEAKPTHRGWVVARGWDESLWKKQEFLNPDEITNRNPVVAIRVDGHMGILNKEGVRNCHSLGIPVSQEGVIQEHGLDTLMSTLKSDFDLRDLMLKAEDYCLSQGITTVSDIEAPEHLEAYRLMRHRLRIVFNPRGNVKNSFKTGQRISENLYMGHIKLFADGSIGARTAVISDGYRDSDVKPTLIHSDNQLEKLYMDAKRNGNEVMTHAIGDVAVDQVIRTIGKFGTQRNKIEHNEFVLPLRTEVEERDMVVSMQPNFLRWSFKGGMYEKRLGSRYIGLNNRFGSLIKNGAIVAFGSDSMPIGPIYGIKLAMNPPTSGQKIKFNQAVKCYTENSAYALHLDRITGSFEQGKSADIAVLDRSDLSVKRTFFGGVEKYRAA